MPALPRPDELPLDIRELVLFQKHDVVHERFGRDIKDLVEAVGILRRPSSSPLAKLRWGVIGAVSAGVVVTGLFASMLRGLPFSQQLQPTTPTDSQLVKSAPAISVTIAAGLSSQQVVDRLKGIEGLSGAIHTMPAEGSLAPDTYRAARGSARGTLLASMQQAQSRILDELWSKRRSELPLKSKEEALVLASIVEKETGHPEQRTRIAAVLINRLRAGMRLQSDPTVLYGLFRGQTPSGHRISRSELEQATPYNTYLINALPPTPICNPSRAAIEAVLNPASTKELYFVADGAGGHWFAETFQDHAANVKRWREITKAADTVKN